MSDLSRWPRCARCGKGVERYSVELAADKDVLVVHVECHGKRESKEIGRATAELMMQPLEFFGEQA